MKKFDLASNGIGLEKAGSLLGMSRKTFRRNYLATGKIAYYIRYINNKAKYFVDESTVFQLKASMLTSKVDQEVKALQNKINILEEEIKQLRS